MSVSKPPQAPASPVTTQQNQQAYGNASSNIGQVASNPYPMQVYQAFSPQMMSTTPYGYDPTQAVAGGNFMAGQGANLYGAGNQILNTGFDPQQQLYQRTQQQVQDQTRAGLEARGLDTSPYGAGVEGQTMANFNIDWQNAQLQRQLQAGQGAAGLYGAGGNQITGGYGFAGQVPQMMSNYAQGLQQFGTGAYGPQQQGAQDFSNLFSAGTSAQQNAYQQALQRYQANQAAQGSFWGGIGNLAGNAATLAFL